MKKILYILLLVISTQIFSQGVNVKVFTEAQAGMIYKRFDGWFEIEPIPLKNGDWYIPVDVLIALRDYFIDSGILDGRPAVKAKAIALRDAVMAMPTYNTADYPQLLYDPNLDIDDPEQIERAQKYRDFKAKYPRDDVE